MNKLNDLIVEIKGLIDKAAADGIVSSATVELKLLPGAHNLPSVGNTVGFTITGATNEGTTEWNDCGRGSCKGILLGDETHKVLQCTDCGRVVE